MKKLLIASIGALIGVYFALSFFTAHAALSILTGQAGGTGFGTTTAGNIGNCLSVSSITPLTYTFSGCSGGAGTSAGESWAFGAAKGWLAPTTTVGIIVNASSTIGSGTQIGGLTINGGATTTGFITVQGTGTSTFSGGVNLNGTDCFAIAGTCLQTFIQNATAYKSAANYATNAVLAGTPAYNNGTAGVGATLTEVGVGALSVDGQAPSVGQRILVKNQADQTQNGVYAVTVAGSGVASYVLTRATDFNTTNDVYAGVTVPILAGGTANGDTSWVESTTGTITIGSSNIAFIESSVGTNVVTSLTAGTNITLSASTGAVTVNGLAFDFTPGAASGASSFYAQVSNATTTQIHFGGSPISLSASSTAVFVSATSTGFTTTNQWFTGLTSGGLGVDASGLVYKAATTTFSSPLTYTPATGAVTCATCNTSAVGLNAIATTSDIGVSQLAYVKQVSGLTTLASVATGTISAGSTAITVTAGRAAVGGALAIDCAGATASQNGCLSSADWATFNAKLSLYDAWTHSTPSFGTTTSATTTSILTQGVFFASSTKAASQFPYASTTMITATTASTTNLIVASVRSALILDGADGTAGAYAGSAPCTNQVALSISAAGVISCSSITAAMLTNADFGDFTVSGGTATIDNGVVTYAKLQTVAANSIIGNKTSATAAPTALATSSELFTGTTGQNVFFNGTNSLTGTSSVFTNTNSFVGIGSTTPWGFFSINSNNSIGTAPIFAIGSSTATQLVILNNGSIGIASTSPLQKFVLQGGALIVVQASPATSTSQAADCGTGPTGSNTVYLSYGTGATTVTLSKMYGGQSCSIVIVNPNAVAGAITWAAASGQVLYWTGGAAPTQTTTANKTDVWSFKAIDMLSTATSTPGVKILGAMTPNF